MPMIPGSGKTACTGRKTLSRSLRHLPMLILTVLLLVHSGALPAFADKGGGGGGGGSSGGGGHDSGHSGGGSGSGSGSSHDSDGESGDDGNGASGARNASARGDREKRFSEGWRIEIHANRYKVYDPSGRLVINRRAMTSDYNKF